MWKPGFLEAGSPWGHLQKIQANGRLPVADLGRIRFGLAKCGSSFRLLPHSLFMHSSLLKCGVKEGGMGLAFHCPCNGPGMGAESGSQMESWRENLGEWMWAKGETTRAVGTLGQEAADHL